MKATRFHHHGGPEVLRYEDAPDPVPAPGRAIVRVRACALNHLDLWQRRGLDRVSIPLPHISGSDVAGEVVDDGGGPVRAGTRVMLQPGLNCGTCRACLAGATISASATTCSALQSDGGYAELVCRTAPEPDADPRPHRVRRGCRFPLTFLTAWHMLVTLAGIQNGDVVLVLAGGSGVGQAAIQIARLHAARVFATSSPTKMEQTRALGVEQVFNHYSGDFGRELKAATNGAGADIVVEHVGEATWERSMRALAAGGRIVTCGATTGAEGQPSTWCTSLRASCRRSGPTWAPAASCSPWSPHFFAGRLSPVIDEIVPLSDAVRAHQRLEARQHFGKIVLTP